MLREETAEEGMLVEDTEKVPNILILILVVIFIVIVILIAVVNCHIGCHQAVRVIVVSGICCH